MNEDESEVRDRSIIIKNVSIIYLAYVMSLLSEFISALRVFR